MTRMDQWCLIFCSEGRNRGTYEIQWQFPTITITCNAIDLAFAKRILEFVAETRNNPRYRDVPLGGGRFRYMDGKYIDLSTCFQEVRITLAKSGESDHGYKLEIECEDRLSLIVGMDDQNTLDGFLAGIQDIADQDCGGPNTVNR